MPKKAELDKTRTCKWCKAKFTRRDTSYYQEYCNVDCARKNSWWGWRPTKKDEEVISKLESIFKIDWTIQEACSYAWISKTTYHDWMNSDKKFSDRIEAAQAYPFILARKTLMKWMQEWNDRSAIEYLKRRDSRYKDKQEITWEDWPLFDKIEMIITKE